MTEVQTREQVLIMHLANKSLDSETVAWAMYDGAAPEGTLPSRPGDEDEPPYRSVLAALQAGWKLLQMSQAPVIPGREHSTSVLPNEFVLTREVPSHD